MPLHWISPMITRKIKQENKRKQSNRSWKNVWMQFDDFLHLSYLTRNTGLEIIDLPFFWFGPEFWLEWILKLNNSGSKFYLNCDFLLLTLIQVDHKISELLYLSKNSALKKWPEIKYLLGLCPEPSREGLLHTPKPPRWI